MSEQHNEKTASGIYNIVALSVWVCGVVISNGFWSTLFAAIIPFWAWYLVAERALTMAGWL